MNRMERMEFYKFWWLTIVEFSKTVTTNPLLDLGFKQRSTLTQLALEITQIVRAILMT